MKESFKKLNKEPLIAFTKWRRLKGYLKRYNRKRRILRL